jgi:hypothetical protein
VKELVRKCEELVKFTSFEETLSVLAALVTGAVAFKLFEASLFTSVLLGALAAVLVAYATWFEFMFADDVVRYRNRFRKIEFPLSYIEKVSTRTFWGGVPGRTFMFLMRSPPAPMNGYFLRTGLISWPSAKKWVEAVNLAIRGQAVNT